jgi:hypothetical protein
MTDPFVERLRRAGYAVDPVYGGDDYPRLGCKVGIDVQKDGYQMQVFDPAGRLLESYTYAETPRAMARMLEEWLNGYAPRLRDRLDTTQESR